MIGNLTLIASIIITVILFLFAKLNTTTPIALWTFLAQLTGLLGSILISWNYLLATRFTIFEKTFDGLDRVYKIHNLIGNLSFIILINHPIFLIISNLPFNSTKLYLIPNLSNLPYALGILSLYSLIIFVSLTIFIDLPYKIWKKTHEAIGLVIILGAIHVLLINSDISVYPPLKIWIIGFNIIAIIAYFYKRYLYYLIQPNSNYIIKEILHQRNYLLISLFPKDNNKIIKFNPGQFAFFSVKNDSRDEHPFSILDQQNNQIKIGTKVIGNFTLLLSSLKEGSEITVRGPYGSFANNISKHNKMVWISGGIGITPFFEMVKALKDDQEVVMIHTAHSSEPRIFSDMYKDLQLSKPNFKFHLHLSDVEGRIDDRNIKRYTSLDGDTYIYICGPSQMMESLSRNLPNNGVKRKRIIFEDFKFK